MKTTFRRTDLPRRASHLAFCIALLAGLALIQACNTAKLAVTHKVSDGYILFAPENSVYTYLIDKNKDTVFTWKSQYNLNPGMAVYLLDSGKLLRAESMATKYCNYPGGRITMYDSNSVAEWSVVISSSLFQQTHDVFPMANGHVLVDVWELISPQTARESGRTVSIPEGGFWSGMVIELAPNYATKSADTVWSWRFWDHLEKHSHPDSIAAHPELLYVNDTGTPCAGPGDWIHMNAVAYNEKLHQVIVSSRNLNEFYIIERTDSTATARGHTGGRYNHGGDFLYRWGCPSAYGRKGPQQLFGQHSVYWLDSSGSRIMLNNDGFGRPPIGKCDSPSWTTCNMTTANMLVGVPVTDSGYSFVSGDPAGWGPATDTTPLNYKAPDSLWSNFEGSAQLLPNGNLLIDAAHSSLNIGGASVFYEVDTATNQIIWDFHASGGAFRAHEYPKAFVQSIFPGLRKKTPQ